MIPHQIVTPKCSRNSNLSVDIAAVLHVPQITVTQDYTNYGDPISIKDSHIINKQCVSKPSISSNQPSLQPNSSPSRFDHSKSHSAPESPTKGKSLNKFFFNKSRSPSKSTDDYSLQTSTSDRKTAEEFLSESQYMLTVPDGYSLQQRRSSDSACQTPRSGSKQGFLSWLTQRRGSGSKESSPNSLSSRNSPRAYSPTKLSHPSNQSIRQPNSLPISSFNDFKSHSAPESPSPDHNKRGNSLNKFFFNKSRSPSKSTDGYSLQASTSDRKTAEELLSRSQCMLTVPDDYSLQQRRSSDSACQTPRSRLKQGFLSWLTQRRGSGSKESSPNSLSSRSSPKERTPRSSSPVDSKTLNKFQPIKSDNFTPESSLAHMRIFEGRYTRHHRRSLDSGSHYHTSGTRGRISRLLGKGHDRDFIMFNSKAFKENSDSLTSSSRKMPKQATPDRRRSLSGNAASSGIAAKGIVVSGRSGSPLNKAQRYFSQESVTDKSQSHSRHSSDSSSGDSQTQNMPDNPPSYYHQRSVPNRFRSWIDAFGRPRSKSDASQHKEQINRVSAAMAAASHQSTTGHRNSIDPIFISTNLSPGLPPIPQGQQLNTSPDAPTGATPVSSSGSSKSSNSTPSGATKKASKGRFWGSPSSPTGSNWTEKPGKLPDPSKMPREQPNSTISFAQGNIRYQRFRKLSYPFPGANDEPVLPPKISQSSTLSRSEETLFAQLGRRHVMDRSMSLQEPTMEMGPALTAMSCGVRRVSENKRYVMLSKSPLMTPDEFMEAGIDLLVENDAYALFFQHSTCYDLIPDSSKLVVLDSQLQVGRAFRALVYNGVRAAPIWSSSQYTFIGMLTISDFIDILHHGKKSDGVLPPLTEEFENNTIDQWREITHNSTTGFHSIRPEASLFSAVQMLYRLKVHRLPVMNGRTGNPLYIITHKRLLKYLYLRRHHMPQPTFLHFTLEESGIGTWQDVATVLPSTPVVDAFAIFVERRLSALPVVTEDGRLIDIYAKFDTIHLAASGDYTNLDMTIEAALLNRKSTNFAGVLTCLKTDKIGTVIEKIVQKEVHRLVIIDSEETRRVIGIISLSDLLNFIVLHQVKSKPTNQNLGFHLSLSDQPIREGHVMNHSSSRKDSDTPLDSGISDEPITEQPSQGMGCNGGIDQWPMELGSTDHLADDELFKMEVA